MASVGDSFEVYAYPGSAIVIAGYIVPGKSIIKAALERLRADLADTVSFPDLRHQWSVNPQQVLADRGFFSDLRVSILQESNIATLEECTQFSTMHSSCCGETLAIV